MLLSCTLEHKSIKEHCHTHTGNVFDGWFRHLSFGWCQFGNVISVYLININTLGKIPCKLRVQTSSQIGLRPRPRPYFATVTTAALKKHCFEKVPCS